MAEKKATREGFGLALAELGEKYDFYVLDADLAAATKTGIFKKKFPDRFFDCGIAEGNMMGVAAGLAATGKKVFAASFAMFAAGRSFEQIRNSIGYPHLNVNIVGTHASITVGEDGATHQCSEDLALMRTIPGMTVICPADVTEAYAAVEAVLNYEGPCYLRFGRYAVPNLTPELLPDYKFEIGKGVIYREGSDVTIVANGYMVHLALEAADILAAEGIKLGYHNHSHEFVVMPWGSTIHGELERRTEVEFEIDTFWAFNAGLDPVRVMERLKHRMQVIHLKDGFKGGKGIPLGQGEAPVKAVIDYAAANGIKMVVESETLTPSGMDEATACMDYLNSIE